LAVVKYGVGAVGGVGRGNVCGGHCGYVVGGHGYVVFGPPKYGGITKLVSVTVPALEKVPATERRGQVRTPLYVVITPLEAVPAIGPVKLRE
jgi:hypothetical protein